MGIISQWRTFAWEHPAKALLLTIIPLAFLMLLGYTFHSAVYDSAMPGALAGTIIALYLALTLFLGLTTPLTVGNVAPVLVYAAATMLWPLTPVDDYDSITYDSGWIGGIIYLVVISSCLICLFAYTGYLIGSPKGKR